MNYTALMTISRRLASYLLATGFVCLLTGCGGLGATYPISPLSFFLPGLVEAPVAPPTPILIHTNLPAASSEARLR
jgi:hypothetical protein